MKSIELKTGVWALLDEEDWERLSRFQWKLSKNGYAYRLKKEEGQPRSVRVFMHREVMDYELHWRKGSWQVHHRDENKLNNQKENLLICEPGWHSRQHGGGYYARKWALRVCGTTKSQKRQTF